MAASKSASRKAAAKKAAKTRKSRPATKKAATKTRKQRAAGTKEASTRKRRAAAKKVSAPRKTNAAVVRGARTVERRRTPEGPPGIAGIDERIAMLRGNLRDLTEQAAAYSGAADEERMSQRIAEQEAKLQALLQERDELSRQG